MKMVNNALSIGSVFGIPIRLHISLLILIGVIGLLSGSSFFISILFAVGLFGSVALHELGHSLVARKKGGYIHEIVLYPFGGAAKISNIPTRPQDEIAVALAGPAVSLVLAILLQLSSIDFINSLGRLNGMLFIFNILPVFPMDGGRVFRALLSMKRSRVEATRIAVKVGKWFCFGFIWIGFFGLKTRLLGFIGPFGPNLILAFIGFYIYNAGKREYQMVLMEAQTTEQYRPTSEGHIDIDVSPPPYASHKTEDFINKIRNLFRR